MDGREAERLAQTLLDAYPQVQLRERTKEIYTKWLLDLDRDSAEEVIGELIAHSPSLPAVAEVRRGVIEREVSLPTGIEAWVSLNERGQEIHELTREVAQLFGGTWGIRTSGEPGITRTQFLKAFEAARERRLRERNVSRLRGRKKRAA